MSQFGATMRQNRLDMGLTQGGVARALGWSPAYLNDIELGRRNPPPNVDSIEMWAGLVSIDPTEARMLALAERDPLAYAQHQRIKELETALKTVLACWGTNASQSQWANTIQYARDLLGGKS